MWMIYNLISKYNPTSYFNNKLQQYNYIYNILNLV